MSSTLWKVTTGGIIVVSIGKTEKENGQDGKLKPSSISFCTIEEEEFRKTK